MVTQAGGGCWPRLSRPLARPWRDGCPRRAARWPSTTPKWLGTFRYIGTHPLRCDGLGCVLGLFVIELGGYHIRVHWSEKLGFPPLFSVTVLPTHTCAHTFRFNGSGFGSVNLDQLAHVQHRSRRFQLLTVGEAHDLDHQRASGLPETSTIARSGKPSEQRQCNVHLGSRHADIAGQDYLGYRGKMFVVALDMCRLDVMPMLVAQLNGTRMSSRSVISGWRSFSC